MGPLMRAMSRGGLPLAVCCYSQVLLVWCLAEGTSGISSDTETILYTFLDIVAKSVFGLLIVSARDGLDGALDKRKQLLSDSSAVTESGSRVGAA